MTTSPNERLPPIVVRDPLLVSLCSEVGRGHPSYLDSVLTALARLPGLGHNPKSPEDFGHVPRLTVAELCTGTSGLAWRLVRAAYRFGAQGGPVTWCYNHLRTPDSRPSRLQLALLGSSLRSQFTGYRGVCVVDHPLLACILAPVCRVAYVHGEIAVPGLSAVPEAWRTFVPLPAAGLRLQAFAVEPAAVTVTGLLVEPLLADVAESALRVRLARLESVEPLTVGLFLSGARPRPHASRMVTVAESLARAGHRAILFWGTGMLDASKVQFELRRRGIPDDAARVVWSRSRADETTRTAEVFASLDVMVAAAHERTNWAVGLGLPMFALLPHIGPFARENFDFASQQGVCLPLASSADAAAFGSTLDTLRRSGGLAEMARAGWGRHPINGAAVAARILADELAQVRTSVLS